MYYVLKLYSVFNPSVLFTTSSKDDAKSYCDIMRRNEPDSKFIVAQSID